MRSAKGGLDTAIRIAVLPDSRSGDSCDVVLAFVHLVRRVGIQAPKSVRAAPNPSAISHRSRYGVGHRSPTLISRRWVNQKILRRPKDSGESQGGGRSTDGVNWFHTEVDKQEQGKFPPPLKRGADRLTGKGNGKERKRKEKSWHISKISSKTPYLCSSHSPFWPLFLSPPLVCSVCISM